ncbi:MAG: putative Zn-dependent protease [Herbinix sp.]|nr:putative Zn-dependent protease [Herbinix sp.]
MKGMNSMLQNYISEFKSGLKACTELRAQMNSSQMVNILKGSLTSNQNNIRKGVSARIYKNGVYGFASASDYNLESVKKVLDTALKNAEFLNSKAKKEPKSLPAGSQGSFSLNRQEHIIPQKYFIDFARETDEYISTHYKNLDSRSVCCKQDTNEKLLCTTDSCDCHTITPRANLYVHMTANDNSGVPISLYEAWGEFGTFDSIYSDPKSLYEGIDHLYERIMQKREAVYAEGGIKQVILDSDLAGILAHEAVGHTVEGDLVRFGSVAGSYRNKQVASELITLVDYANSYEGKLLGVPIFVDDEGTKAEDVVLIERGILKEFMHNKETAAHFGTVPKGNARANEFIDEPLVRMRNTAILPGKSSLEEMIASVEDGYYFMKPTNGQADLTGEFMFGVAMGYEIKKGKVGRAVKETTISGIAFDLLKTVDMVSDEMVWKNTGWCGKKQWIPVSMGGPAIRCKINVGGK